MARRVRFDIKIGQQCILIDMPAQHMIHVAACAATVLAFNAAALNTVLNTGTRGAALDPALNSASHILAFLVGLLLCAANLAGAYCAYGAVVACLMVYKGVYLPAYELYSVGDPHQAYTTTAFPGTIGLHILSAITYLYSVRCCFKANSSGAVKGLQVVAGLACIASLVVVVLTGLPGQKCNDGAAWLSKHQEAMHRPFQFTSQFVTMRDGVRLAVDVYLPDGWQEGSADAQLPTLILLTRYNRNRKLHWPWMYFGFNDGIPRSTFSLTMNKYVTQFVPRGYACLAVDVRGTGASFGHRHVDLSQAEIEDYNEVLIWAKQQPWSNGRVGSAGISYDGIAAAMLASHGGVDAVGMLFSPVELQMDFLAPGGVLNVDLLKIYSSITHASERNRRDIIDEKVCPLPFGAKFFFKYVVGGVFPVAGDEYALQQAVAEHDQNWDILDHVDRYDGFAGGILLKDGDKDRLLEDFGLSEEPLQKLKSLKTSIAMWAGYWDHASVQSCLRLARYLGESVRVTMGPWAHGASSCFTPRSPGYKRSFAIMTDVFDFFECKLREKCAALSEHREPYQYFHVGREEWTASEQFPPSGTAWATYYLSATRGLVDSSQREQSIIQYTISNATTTGFASRWNVISHVLGHKVTYPNRMDDDDELLAFNSETLTSAIQLIGSTQVNVTLELQADENAVVFVYLEDVDPLGARVHYVTEGMLRVGHGVTHRNPTVGAWDSVERSFRREHFTMPTGPVPVEIVMQPMVYTFAVGHQIRLSVAGADRDNFDLTRLKNLAKSWKVHLGYSTLKIPTTV